MSTSRSVKSKLGRMDSSVLTPVGRGYMPPPFLYGLFEGAALRNVKLEIQSTHTCYICLASHNPASMHVISA